MEAVWLYLQCGRPICSVISKLECHLPYTKRTLMVALCFHCTLTNLDIYSLYITLHTHGHPGGMTFRDIYIQSLYYKYTIADINILYKIGGYNYQVLYATSFFLQERLKVNHLLGMLWVILDCPSTVATCFIFDFMECIKKANKALYINGSHILYYHIDLYRSTMLGHSYFTSPDYLVVQECIRALIIVLLTRY